MEIPKSIRVAGYDYSIGFLDEVTSDDGECCGTCDFNKYEIKISKRLTKQQQLSTFIHEYFEAVNHVYGINLKHNQIEAIESGVYQLCQQIMK
jgi:hypothetical protein